MAIFALVLGAIVYLVLAATAVGRQLEVSVVVPAKLPEPRGERPLLVFLHGRGGSEGTFTGNEAMYAGLAKLGGRAPIVAFPDGGEHSYWHDRAEGNWGRYVMREVIPAVERRFGTDPHRIAIGGISMGGFGAYDLALHHPRRFCAAGGHSAALWFEAGETAPGAFEGPADFARNDVVATVQADPSAFERGDADFTTHSWPGGHDNGYWNARWAQYLRFYANSLAHCG